MDGRQHLCLRTSLGKPALALSMQSKPFLIGYNKSAQGDTPAKQTHTHGRMDTHSTSTRTHAHTHTCRNVRCPYALGTAAVGPAGPAVLAVPAGHSAQRADVTTARLLVHGWRAGRREDAVAPAAPAPRG